MRKPAGKMAAFSQKRHTCPAGVAAIEQAMRLKPRGQQEAATNRRILLACL